MIALSIIAAGIIAIAAALFLRPSFELRTADQRGITLQTLIVTAVLVLMAGAAGVVIIAITNNAQDNLENQNTGINSRCEPWEIFDPTLSAAGRGGGQGGIDSTAIGCIRVCYVEYTSTVASTGDTLTTAATTGNVDLRDGASTPATDGKLLFSRSDILVKPAANVARVPVSGPREVDINGNAGTGNLAARKDAQKIAEITTTNEITGAALDNYEIRVATNQRYCEVWNNTTDQQEFRSKN